MKKVDMHGVSEREGKAWGRGEFANMPSDVQMKMYPKANQFGPDVLDDTMVEIDRVNSVAHTKSHRNLSNQH